MSSPIREIDALLAVDPPAARDRIATAYRAGGYDMGLTAKLLGYTKRTLFRRVSQDPLLRDVLERVQKQARANGARLQGVTLSPSTDARHARHDPAQIAAEQLAAAREHQKWLAGLLETANARVAELEFVQTAGESPICLEEGPAPPDGRRRALAK